MLSTPTSDTSGFMVPCWALVCLFAPETGHKGPKVLEGPLFSLRFLGVLVLVQAGRVGDQLFQDKSLWLLPL